MRCSSSDEDGCPFVTGKFVDVRPLHPGGFAHVPRAHNAGGRAATVEGTKCEDLSPPAALGLDQQL